MKYSFLSPNLKYNNGLIYYLNMNEINNTNYKDNNYYIEEKEITNNGKLKEKDIEYNIIYSKFDDNVIIEIESTDEIDKKNILKYMFNIQEKIKVIDDLYILQEYNKYKDIFNKYENNIIS